MCCGNVIL